MELEKTKEQINKIVLEGDKKKILGYIGEDVPTNELHNLIDQLKSYDANFTEDSIIIEPNNLKTHNEQFLFCLNLLFFIVEKLNDDGINRELKYSTEPFCEAHYNKSEPNNTFDSFEQALPLLKYLNNGDTEKEILFNLLVFNCYINLIYSGILHHRTILFNPKKSLNNNGKVIYQLMIDQAKIVAIDPISINNILNYIRLILDFNSTGLIKNNKFKNSIMLIISNRNSSIKQTFEDYFFKFFTTETIYFKYLYSSKGLIIFLELLLKFGIRIIDTRILKDINNKAILPIIRNRLHTDFHKTWDVVIRYANTISN